MKNLVTLTIALCFISLSCNEPSISTTKSNEIIADSQIVENRISDIDPSNSILHSFSRKELNNKFPLTDSSQIKQEQTLLESNEEASKKIKTNEKELDKVIKKKAIKKSARIHFENPVFNFDTIQEGDKFEHKFIFTNTGKAPLVIHGTEVSCGCTIPSYPFIPVEPGEQGYIGVIYKSVGKEGLQKPSITVISNAKKSKVKLEMLGTVLAKTEGQ